MKNQLNSNIILDTDGYKASHYLQTPPGIKNVSSYIEAREGGEFDEVVFFGLQAHIKRYLTTPITKYDIDEADGIFSAYGTPFNRAGWEHILNVHGGMLPLVINALPEGMVVPCGTPLVQMEATDDACEWLISPMETSLLRAVWYPVTVCTYSYQVKKMMKSYLDDTSDVGDEVLPFMLHDFGARGASSYETSAIGGAAHLVNFLGTDTVAALPFLRDFYAAPAAGFSVPASEHSTMTAWGEDNEAAAYENMIDQFDCEGGIVSIVSDSYDLYNAIDNIYGGVLKDKILNMKGRLVIRPDSGDPVDVSCKSIEKLYKIFGGTINSKGYKVLNDKVRVLWGDGVNMAGIERILEALKTLKFSAENIIFGMGGGLLQDHTRDKGRFAQKCNAIMTQDDLWMDVYKRPKTDTSKASKAGRQVVLCKDGVWSSEKVNAANIFDNRLEQVYYAQNGIFVLGNTQTLTQIRKRAEV